MLFRSLVSAAALSLAASSAFAEINVSEAYARAMPGSSMGAVFMVLENTGDTEQRVVSARSDASDRVELHTHIQDENGVFRMREVEDGFLVEPGKMRMLERGGDHVMLMGLNEELSEGDEIEVVLVFESGEEVTVTAAVDNDRAPEHGHGEHGHGDHTHHGDHAHHGEHGHGDHAHGDHKHGDDHAGHDH